MTPTLPPPALLPRALSTAQFQTLAEVPPEIEWFANLTNANTRRAYEQDITDFMAFAGLRQPEQFRDITRAHVIAWREQLVGQELANDTTGASSRPCRRSMPISATVTPCCITPCSG